MIFRYLNSVKYFKNLQVIFKYTYMCIYLTCTTCQVENFKPPEGNIFRKTVGD